MKLHSPLNLSSTPEEGQKVGSGSDYFFFRVAVSNFVPSAVSYASDFLRLEIPELPLRCFGILLCFFFALPAPLQSELSLVASLQN